MQMKFRQSSIVSEEEEKASQNCISARTAISAARRPRIFISTWGVCIRKNKWLSWNFTEFAMSLRHDNRESASDSREVLLISRRLRYDDREPAWIKGFISGSIRRIWRKFFVLFVFTWNFIFQNRLVELAKIRMYTCGVLIKFQRIIYWCAKR